MQKPSRFYHRVINRHSNTGTKRIGNQDIVRILQQPEVKERFLRQGAEPVFGTPEQFLKLQQEEYVRIRKLVKDIGIEPR